MPNIRPPMSGTLRFAQPTGLKTVPRRDAEDAEDARKKVLLKPIVIPSHEGMTSVSNNFLFVFFAPLR